MDAVMAVALLGALLVWVWMLWRREQAIDAAMEELERWRAGHNEAERWLAEFRDVADALAHLKAKADGTGGTDINHMRNEMRRRRDWQAARGDR